MEVGPKYREELSRTGELEPGAVHVTVERFEKLLPAMVTSVAVPFTVAADGERPDMAGAGATVNAEVAEGTPSALTTWMLAGPCALRSAAGIVADMEVAPEYADDSVVVTELKVHVTVDPLVKLVPVMVTERSVWPAVAVDTERLPMAGAAATVNVAGAEVRLPALTVIWPLPAVARCAAGIVADMEVALESVDDSVVATELNVHFHSGPIREIVPRDGHGEVGVARGGCGHRKAGNCGRDGSGPRQVQILCVDGAKPGRLIVAGPGAIAQLIRRRGGAIGRWIGAGNDIGARGDVVEGRSRTAITVTAAGDRVQGGIDIA